MPIWLRKFTFNSIKEYHQKIAEASKKAAPKKKQSFGPNVQPSFTSKASKK